MLLKKCPRCGAYSLRDICPECGVKTVSAHPPKFSLLDKYGKWRQKAKLTMHHIKHSETIS
ncbi:MAG: RNA-protein complex protein Nop10 [Candidatus Aenigmatarchaeota archaeon]|nr:MAG: RNA-protein complex protein Nop10 [Candidatus Aenigmarchaeota archaeon]